MEKNHLAIIGSGPTALYLLKHIATNSAILKEQISSITIFEKRGYMGMGMPYTPETTDVYNLANISSEEIPELTQSFVNWLKTKDKEQLKKWNITAFPISESEVYSRLALGYYFHNQYQKIISQLKAKGFTIVELPNHKVTDVLVNKEVDEIEVKVGLVSFLFSKVVIAMGHHWSKKDQPEKGYYASPWPIAKLLPKKKHFYNYEIGTLGASLSALDIVTSLAHRHGKFRKSGKGLTYHLAPSAKGFKIILHSAEGWLPHLQYAQRLPIREVYRHTTREKILSLVNKENFLELETFFDAICRPALISAFKKDQKPTMVKLMKDADFTFKDFVIAMSQRHHYSNSFEGMKEEKRSALDSVQNNAPVHWKETLDDLMYCLNFHLELISAEDYLFFTKEVMPFLMNVIAALPLKSANIVLALYEAGCIELEEGKVEILESDSSQTIIQIEDLEGMMTTKAYSLFIDCSGEAPIDIKKYPFQSMVKQGVVRKASRKFQKTPKTKGIPTSKTIYSKGGGTYLYPGGIDVDATYRIIDKKGKAQSHIYDASFPHIMGTRPYSFGIQACHATSLIIVQSWLESNNDSEEESAKIEQITKVYEGNGNL
ncbi:FAD/NAD(P)-binding protein [Flavobacterium sp. UMI-01]|uniref:FAD/NAD(P)-binding protein n=1 Tax=Flavobacterium sp. UMI-01 TaxID=1441053 RepID=UPI001C7D8D55|nr:FAD/NAD(P)-binding protein [Flavobacterium sp. UMI-01]GIZ08174.1 FAD/NAD(P) binding domain-containing protein [Flavobacterium sp. UMI-01]